MQCNGTNETETLLCDVIAVLNTAACLRQKVVRGEGFGSKYKPYFTWEMAEDFGGHFSLVFRRLFVCAIEGTVKLQIVCTPSY